MNINHSTRVLTSSFLGGIEKVVTLIHVGITKVLRGVTYLKGRIDFKAREDDIFVASYPRSGTTLLQNIVYLLTHDGDSDFQHISKVSPYFEYMLSQGLMRGRDFNELPGPRIIKSHLPYSSIPKGPGKYIYIYRNVNDVIVSYYYFARSSTGYDGNFEDFYSRFMNGKLLRGSWFDHVGDWLDHDADEQVLLLRYEDVIHNKRAAITRIARFCNIEPTPALLDKVEVNSSFAFMKANENKFEHHLGKVYELELKKGFRQGEFIRKGESSANDALLSSLQRQELERRASRLMEIKST